MLKLLIPLTLKPLGVGSKSSAGYLTIVADLKVENDSLIPLSLGSMETLLCLSIMYQSVPSLTIPPGDPRGFAHSSCPWGRVFAPLSCPGSTPGVLNQSKSSIILEKSAIFALSLKQLLFSYVYICQK